ncbi:MAG: hypothetical protein ACK4UJ_08200 [Leptonema sp. (in: bacteria)]
MIFYKKNQPFPILSYIENSTFTEILLLWEEKLESPLSGTTKKKNYQTKINIIQLEIDQNVVKNKTILYSTTIPYWILSEFVYTIQIDPLKMFFLYGEGEYGVHPKFGYYYKDHWMEISKDVVYFVPSPNKNYLATLEKKDKTYLNIYQILDKEIELLQKSTIFLSKENYLTWDSKKRNIVYLYQENQVYEYNVDTNTLQKSKEYPECILPSTSFGLNRDNKGNQFFYDTEIKEYRIETIKEFKSFYEKKYIKDPSQIRHQCF